LLGPYQHAVGFEEHVAYVAGEVDGVKGAVAKSCGVKAVVVAALLAGAQPVMRGEVAGL
jgi:hypothetical protein